ncbi:MAG: phosphatase PAP2 family protein [Melioribacteraceae bacterium]|nr:phosphatase PAP2 family protein [Melioribacteraceae bacterium]
MQVSFLLLVTAYSRVYENRHWLSDVVLGGIIGYTTAKFFVKEHDEKEFQEFITPTPIFSFSISL